MANNDFFVVLGHNKYAELVEKVEHRVTALVHHRHEYPIWPQHDQAMDAWEREFHGTIRQPYYASTIFMIQILRMLRSLE